MISQSQKKAVAKYKKAHYQSILIQFNKDTESDILDFLSTLPKGEKSGFIKRAIRSQIENLNL